MSVVMCVKTVGAMTRWCAIATVVTMILVGCRSSREVTAQRDVHKIVREIDTLVTIPGGEAQMIADVSVNEGKLTIGSVSTTGDGVQLSARVEEGVSGAYRLVVEADVADQEVRVQQREEMTDVIENKSEERQHDSRVLPVWVVLVTVAIVLTVIYILRRWKKK